MSTAPSIRSIRCRRVRAPLRQLGIAARFVSGYLFVPSDGGHLGGGSTHAWVQVYLPSAGWIEFDPTNGIVGTRDLIRVAVARDPRQAIPLHGTYLGPADAFIGMEVDIRVVSDDEGVDA
jgi:transglutaminase-like putative cysteine protease